MRHHTAPVVLLAAAIALSGCATRRAPSLADRFMVHREANEEHDRREPPPPSLEETIAKLRKLMAEARPEPRPAPTTLEDRDAVLIAARARLQASPTPDTFIEVADVYRRRGSIDQAY